jgi:hypothetical protein
MYFKRKAEEFTKKILESKMEEAELYEEAEEHIVKITVSEPNKKPTTTVEHTRIFKASSKEVALEMAKKHYRKLGFRIHRLEYVGLKR